MDNYVVATIKKWNIKQYNKSIYSDAENWFLIDNNHDLTVKNLRKINPRYIFFPHWSWIVPDSILDEFNCICFHMTDVPYGRGGSPLQNLIIRGHKKTKLTALKMTNALDAGPVYLKCEMELTGSATEIFKRSAALTFEMIKKIVATNPEPIEQAGEVTEFLRRTSKESELMPSIDLEGFYNTVRMLDAESYPNAYIKLGNLRLSFAGISKNGNELSASVTIIEEGHNDK